MRRRLLILAAVALAPAIAWAQSDEGPTPPDQAGVEQGEAREEEALEVAATPAEPEAAQQAQAAPPAAPAEPQAEGPDRPQEEEPAAAPSAQQEGLRFTGRFSGEYQHRFVAMSHLPLMPLPRTGAEQTGRLGQNWWGEQWLRLRAELALQPILRLYAEADLLWGLAYGETTLGVAPAAWARDGYGYPGLRLRQLYLEWMTPIGLIRAGQMGFTWGLGMLANDGNTPPPFGDSRYGDMVRRVLFATRPFGRETPITMAVAGDWVAWDLLADYERREDLAFQGLFTTFWEEGENRFGGFVAYRTQTNKLNDSLDVFIADVFGRFFFDEPSGGRLFVASEIAYVRGTTTMLRTVTYPTQDVEQLMAIVQLGRRDPHLEIVLEGGYASGDSNAEDAIQRRATMDPDHRVGLILFPEVIAWQSARSAYLAESPELFGRPARGTSLLPTNGGVSGAYYFFPYAIWRPFDWIDFRLGAVLGFASSDVVDLYVQRSRSRSVNYRGGDPTRRDLGLELDGAVLLHGPITPGVTLSGGVEGGVLFPGHAFDDDNGVSMDTMGLVRLRLGLAY